MGYELRGFRLFRIVDLSPISYQGRLHVCGLDFFGRVLSFRNENYLLTILPEWNSGNIFHHQPSSSTIAKAYLSNMTMAIRKGDLYEWKISNLIEGWWRALGDNDMYEFIIPPCSRSFQQCLKPLYGKFLPHLKGPLFFLKFTNYSCTRFCILVEISFLSSCCTL